MAYPLLCTFATLETCDEVIDYIYDRYELPYENVYIFVDENDENSLILTYNVSHKVKLLPRTVAIHRKPITNTLYTINAINMIITNEVGWLDKNYIIDWYQYENMLLVVANDYLKKISLRFIKKVSE